MSTRAEPYQAISQQSEPTTPGQQHIDILLDRREPSSERSISRASQRTLEEPQIQHDARSFADRIWMWWKRRITLRIWWWEATCCILVVGALLGIVITIRVHEHKPLPEWRFGLSINTLIAIFTVIMKASAGLTLAQGISHLKWTNLVRPTSLRTFRYHDEASRGPEGSIKLLWNNKGMGISSLGAFVTLLVLLLDPFSQQIVQFYACSQEADDRRPTIARAQYSAPDTTTDQDNYNDPFSLDKTVTSALYGSSLARESLSCSTGNCTFEEEYHSLALCSRCKDRTNELLVNVSNVTFQDLVHSNSDDPDKLEVHEYPGLKWNITLPKFDMNGEDVNLTGNSSTDALVMSVNTRRGDSDLVGIRFDYEEPDNILAFSCNMIPCIRTYTAEVESGVLKETLKRMTYDAFNLTRPNMGSWWIHSAVDLHCLNSPQVEKLKRIGYTWAESAQFIPYRVSVLNGTKEQPLYIDDDPDCATQSPNGERISDLYDPISPCTDHPPLYQGKPPRTSNDDDAVPARCIYSMDYTVSAYADNYLTSKFSAAIENPKDNLWTNSHHDHIAALYGAGSGKGTFQDVSEFFDNITHSLTTWIRRNGVENLSEPAYGKVYYTTTCIKVQWPWVSYAIMTTVLLLVFFITTVVTTRMDQERLRGQWRDGKDVQEIHDFKAGALTLLHHGFDRESEKMLERLHLKNSESELKVKLKEVNITLVATEQGWKLKVL